MINPISFDRSWIEAEKRAFDIVVEATQSRVNYDAFLGHDRGVVNAWYFASDSLQDIGESVLLADNVPTIGIPYYAECMFIDRARCQQWAMRIMATLPRRNDSESNIALFRSRSLGGLTAGEIVEQGSQKPVIIWQLRIGFDLVFTTGGKRNAI